MSIYQVRNISTHVPHVCMCVSTIANILETVQEKDWAVKHPLEITVSEHYRSLFVAQVYLNNTE